MVRKFAFLKRKRGMDWADFSRHWRTTHATLFAGLPQFWKYTARYIQNHVRPAIPGFTDEPLWDGLVECWETDQSDYLKGFTEEPVYMEMIRPDELNFVEFQESMKLFATENIVIDGPREGIKFLALARRAPGVDVHQFQRYWVDVHARKVRKNREFRQHARRYVQHHVMPETVQAPAGLVPYDGIVELWFDSIPGAIAAFSSKSYLDALRTDEHNFVAKPPSPRLVVDEIVIPRPTA
jgi:EthD domain